LENLKSKRERRERERERESEREREREIESERERARENGERELPFAHFARTHNLKAFQCMLLQHVLLGGTHSLSFYWKFTRKKFYFSP
jgi:hypothetical protein